MARTTKKTAIKTAASSLPSIADPDTAPPVSRLEGRKLLPAGFKPEAGRPVESDGAPLSRLGGRFREVFAEAHGIDPSEVDLGILRQIEALSADHDYNINALSVLQTKRTEHGSLVQVRMIVNTPLLMPWLANGRSLRRMGNELRGATRIVTEATDHPTLKLPEMDVDGPEAVLDIVSAQRRVLNLDTYSTASPRKKDRIDSIVQFGILDPPDVVLTHLVSPEGDAWVPQAAEGAQRYFSAILAMEALANRDVTGLASEAWFNRGEPRFRDLEPNDLTIVEDALSYSATAAASFFPGRDQTAWLESVAATTPAAVAFQLLRTTEVNLILAVHPDPAVTGDFKNPVAETIQEMIRGYHMPGKAKDAWDDADLSGLIAMGAIDEFASTDRIQPEERAAWFGEVSVEWSGPATDVDGLPGNTLVMVTKLLATLTVQNAVPDAEGTTAPSLAIVNRHLKLNGRRIHADDRAKVAAAQAIVALGMYGHGWENTLQAALFGLFRHNWFWRSAEHDGHWPELLGLPVKDLAAQARLEQPQHTGSVDDGGPAQRALAALGGVALMLNPGLIADRTALTRTGLGGGGKAGDVNATDPSNLLRTMAQNPAGIDQLEDAVLALVASAQPAIPIDRDDDEQLTDLYLRRRWLGSTRDDPDNPFTEFARQLEELIEKIETNSKTSDELRVMTRGNFLGLEMPDEGDLDARDTRPDDSDLWGDPLYETVGITAEAADRAIGLLQNLSDFFHTGKAYARAAGRASR